MKKKLIVVSTLLLLVFLLVGCDLVPTVTSTSTTDTTSVSTSSTTTSTLTTNVTVTTTQSTTTTSTVTTEPPTTTPPTTTTQEDYTLPEEDVEITFWHIFGTSKISLLDQFIADFEEMYPNVTITATSKNDYSSLQDQINMGIAIGQTPTMAVGYLDNFMGYYESNALVSLNQYIYSDATYEVTNTSSSIYGQTVSTAINLDSYISAFIEENRQYADGQYYSLPFMKTSDVMAVNRTALEEHLLEIRAAGIEISDNGFLSHETALTYEQLELLSSILVDTNGTNATTYQCEYLVNYDSPANLFINMSRQWNAAFTDAGGAILMDNSTTISMLSYLDSLYQSNTIVLPIAWNESYGSTNFVYGDVCMTVGSTAGITYNVPSSQYSLESLQLGVFEFDVLPMPQFVVEDGASFTIDEVSYTGSLSSNIVGANIGIFANATEAERLYALLFIEYITNVENSALWAMNMGGYLPLHTDSYLSETVGTYKYTENVTFKDFMSVAQEYWDADGNVNWSSTDDKWDLLYYSMAINVAYNQLSYGQIDNYFMSGSNSASSSVVREEAKNCLENIYSDVYSPTEALSFMIDQLIW